MKSKTRIATKIEQQPDDLEHPCPIADRSSDEAQLWDRPILILPQSNWHPLQTVPRLAVQD